jgi:hypothetical protein
MNNDRKTSENCKFILENLAKKSIENQASSEYATKKFPDILSKQDCSEYKIKIKISKMD